MAPVYNVLGMVCFVVLSQSTELQHHLLARRAEHNSSAYFAQVLPSGPAKVIVAIAQSQIGVRENTGKNDGVVVESYLAYTGLGKGHAWCAAFVSWVFGKAGYAQPKFAWSPSLFPKARLTEIVSPAAVFGIYDPNKKRIAHVGLVLKRRGSWIYTIEGNTNVQGGREGDGVYERMRHVKTVAKFADWLPQKGAKR